ncbi:tetratricopeptide repeat protein [Candidatus Thioglobus autotrophicus]|uniref:tetratricopeptide repeat protein n=1 Tax=Candidatus Thioglobus autotrophicus TaxID=1705394 RepID=UPI0006B48BA8|nr:tetratricopeptide repeat protein [Candidatus Thioglobus autotrophicus]WPE16668.1 tetratricopeptide repeat protein [Candidatus Thioglobus autotrophicus]
MIKTFSIIVLFSLPVQALQILQSEKSHEVVAQQSQVLDESIQLSNDLLLTKLEKSAKSGDARAQFSLANMYHHGIGIKTDEKLAFYWYSQVAEQGYASAQFNIANGYYHGIGTAQDLTQAQIWYEKAAEQDFVAAQYNLAVMYRRGEGSKVDNQQAFRWYERAAQLGYGVAQLTLAKLYEEGVGVEQDDSLAQAWYLKAASQYDSEAQFHLADFYQKRNQYAQAVYYYRKASDQGHIQAQYALAMNLFAGVGVIEDEAQAQQLLLEAAQAGHAKSQLQLGQGLLANDQLIEAKKWLIKASDQQEKLASTLLEDLATLAQSKQDALALEVIDPQVPSLLPEAIKLLPAPESINQVVSSGVTIQPPADMVITIPNQQQILDSLNSHVESMVNVEKLLKSAQQGNPIAQHNLSTLYSIGELVAKDERQAFLLMQQSANQDLTRSQNSLAMMYINGVGVAPDYKKAYYWASVSARKGDAEGKRILAYLVSGSL